MRAILSILVLAATSLLHAGPPVDVLGVAKPPTDSLSCICPSGCPCADGGGCDCGCYAGSDCRCDRKLPPPSPPPEFFLTDAKAEIATPPLGEVWQRYWINGQPGPWHKMPSDAKAVVPANVFDACTNGECANGRCQAPASSLAPLSQFDPQPTYQPMYRTGPIRGLFRSSFGGGCASGR